MIILLSGYARAGKDTVADYLVEHKHFEKYAFAEPIYQGLAVMYMNYLANTNCFPTLPGMIDYIKANKNANMPFTNKTWREGLQNLGTEWGRDFLNKDIWILLALEYILSIQNREKNLVISDCRFLNEYEIIKEKLNNIDPWYHCYLWYIDNPRAEPQLQHRSEQEVQALKNKADLLIHNDGTITELYAFINTQI